MNTPKQEYLERYNTKKFMVGLSAFEKGLDTVLPGLKAKVKRPPKNIDADYTIFDLEEKFNEANNKLNIYSSFNEFMDCLKTYGILFESYSVVGRNYNFKLPRWFFTQSINIAIS